MFCRLRLAKTATGPNLEVTLLNKLRIATTSADFFGTRYLGLNYGLLFTAYGVAGIIGPLIASRVFSASGSYANAFYIAAGLSVIAVISISMARPPSREAST